LAKKNVFSQKYDEIRSFDGIPILNASLCILYVDHTLMLQSVPEGVSLCFSFAVQDSVVDDILPSG
jgi:hypothetical protein